MRRVKSSCWIVNTHHGDFLTDRKDFIGRIVYNSYEWEPELIKVYTALLSPQYTVLDIGAHMGFHTISFASKAKQVYAFEPQIHLHNQVCGNVFLNQVSDKVTCYNVGLGEAEKRSSFGSLDKHNSLNWEGNTGIEVVNYGGRSLEDNLGTNEIEVKTLDSFQLTPQFIKIDVEGYELKVLQGASKTLQQHSPIILFESFQEAQPEVFTLLKSINYEIYNLPGTALHSDFVAIHPQFMDYVSSKEKLESFQRV